MKRKFIAVAERGERPGLAVYDLHTLKRKKVMVMPAEMTALELVAIEFTFDTKFLVAITGDPDWMLLYYNWEKGKVDSFTKANNPQNPGPVTAIACNPTDNSVLVIVGPGLFKLLIVTEAVWRQFGYQKADILSLTCVCWLTFDRIITGTKNGHLVVIDGGDLKAVFKATETNFVTMASKDENLSLSATSLRAPSEECCSADAEVRALVALTKGFAYACGPGQVHLFETVTKQRYRRHNLILIPQPLFDQPDITLIQCLAVNLSQDVLIATTGRTQLYTVRLWEDDIALMPEIYFTPLGEPLHHGAVISLSICAWKPLFMTCGELDRTVRVWNYETETQEIIKQYEEDVFTVALHPTGLFCLVGFSDKLYFMILLMDDLQLCRDFPIRTCRECCFSANGHFFAAANGNIIQIYSVVSFHNLYNLRGHNGKVCSICWTLLDTRLVSCGSEGALYEWDMSTGKRSAELISKACTFSGIVSMADGKTVFGIGEDGFIKEVVDSSVQRSLDVMSQSLTCITMARSDLMVFIAASTGVLLSINFPLTEPIDYKDFHMHHMSVTRMALSYDDQTLITCSRDGSVIIWKVTLVEGKAIIMDKEFSHAKEILINKEDLEEKMISNKDLTQRIHELASEQVYQIRQIEVANEEKLKEVHEGYCAAIEELKEKNEQQELEHTQEITKIDVKISSTKHTHDLAMQTLEANYNGKLIFEYDKYQLLEERTMEMRNDYERKLSELIQSKKGALSELTEKYEGKLHDKKVQISEIEGDIREQAREYEEIKQQIENDADREILDLKARYEKKLRAERENNTRLRGEIGVLKKKFIMMQKETDEAKHRVNTLQGEQAKFQQIIGALEKDVIDLKKEIGERDVMIQEKEKRIYELNRRNQELEKIKFVLNYKITELKSQIEPKDRDIKSKKEQIQDMELELENLQKTNTSLELQLAELREKLGATDNELRQEKSHNREANALLRRIRLDLHEASGLVQEPKKLRDAVRTLYHKYNQDQELMVTCVQDVDAQVEFKRQREHLERTVAALKRQNLKDTSNKQSDDLYRIIQENATLIVEINKLRKELKMAQRHIRDMESILGIGGKSLGTKEAQTKLGLAIASTQQVHREYRDKMQEYETMVSVLREEVQRLVGKLNKTDQDEYYVGEREKRLNLFKRSDGGQK